MSDSISLGAIGTSSIMEYIQRGIALTEGLSCRVVYSRDTRRGAAFAEKMGIPESTDDLESLLSRPDIQAVYVASPNKFHPEQAIRAMEHGKHVFVEKPAAVRTADLEAMIHAAEQNGVFFFECITTIFMPNFQKWKTFLPSIGAIGEAEIFYGQYSSRYDAYLRGEDPNIFNPAMDGGALNDLGIYAIHGAIDLFGAPTEVRYDPELGENGIDLAGVLTLRYPTFSCRIHTAKNRPMDSGCRITGKNGTLESHGPLNAFSNCTVCLQGSFHEIREQSEENRMIYEFARFRDAITDHDVEFFREMCRRSMLAASILERARD